MVYYFWIDHCLSTQDPHSAITDVLILHDFVTSDHLPLCINISMEAIPSTSTIVYDDVLTKRIWSKADMSTLDNYSTAVNRAISSIPLDILEALECKDVHCTKSCHCIKLDKTYDFIVTVLKDCSNTVIPSRSAISKDIKYKVMPGWNEHVREAHTAARESFKAWQFAGKPQSEQLVKTLCMFFTSLLVHGYMPQAMIKSVLVPVVKNKTRSITDKSNYRPTAISTVLSKVFEFVLFGKMEPYLLISDNQFGYQKGLGNQICIFTLMETIRHYQMSGSYVFICYLDATAIPLYIIRILFYWYIH